MPSTQEKLASQMYWLTGYGTVLPYVPVGTLEVGELAHVQGLYAGMSFSTGVVVVAADVSNYRPHLRVRRR